MQHLLTPATTVKFEDRELGTVEMCTPSTDSAFSDAHAILLRADDAVVGGDSCCIRAQINVARQGGYDTVSVKVESNTLEGEDQTEEQWAVARALAEADAATGVQRVMSQPWFWPLAYRLLADALAESAVVGIVCEWQLMRDVDHSPIVTAEFVDDLQGHFPSPVVAVLRRRAI